MFGFTDDFLYNSAPSAVSTQPGSFDVFASDNDGNLNTRHFDGISWSPDIGWQHMVWGVRETGTSWALALYLNTPTEQYDVLTRATNDYMVTIYNNPDTPEYFSFEWFSEVSKVPPIKIVTGPNAVELFFIGTDDTISHRHYLGDDDWTPIRSLGDQKFISPPTPVTIAPGRVDLFGIAPDRTVLYNTYQDGEWTGWKQLGTRRFASAISAVVPQGTNHIELWGLGYDGELWHRGYDGTGWQKDWDSHRGSFISAPAVISSSAGVYDVFDIGSDGALRHARHIDTPDTWIPAYRTWKSLNGSLHVFE